MGVLSAVAVRLKTTTTTLHFRPIAFQAIFGGIFFAVALTGFFWVYCSNSEYDEQGNLVKEGNCPVGNRWDSDYWGEPYCLSGYCETCYMQDYVRSRANSYSNVGFIAGGILILGFTIEGEANEGQQSDDLRRCASNVVNNSFFATRFARCQTISSLTVPVPRPRVPTRTWTTTASTRPTSSSVERGC